MALDASVLAESTSEDMKGRAVYVLHTWKDHLWAMGKGGDVPPAVEVAASEEAGVEEESRDKEGEDVTDAGADESVLHLQDEEHSATKVLELKDRRELESNDRPINTDPASSLSTPSDPLVRTLSPEGTQLSFSPPDVVLYLDPTWQSMKCHCRSIHSPSYRTPAGSRNSFVQTPIISVSDTSDDVLHELYSTFPTCERSCRVLNITVVVFTVQRSFIISTFGVGC